MSNINPQINSPDAANSGDIGARKLQSDLDLTLRTWSTSIEERKSAFEKLRTEFLSGQYGGLPVKGDAPMALISLLQALHWDISVKHFARAVPHFPQQFTIVELQETLARLGYQGTVRHVSVRRLSSAQLPAIAVDGKRLVVLLAGENNQLIVHDPITDTELPLDRSKRRRVISFAPESEDVTKLDTESWLRRTLNRFLPEIRQLLLLTAFINSSVLILSFAVMTIFDKVIPAGALDTLLGLGAGVLLTAGLELYFRGVKAKLIGRVSGRIEYLLGTTIFAKLISLPVPMLANTPIGDQIGRLRQFETLRDLFAGPFAAIVLEIPFLLVFIACLFAIGGYLGFIPVALAAVYAIMGGLLVGPVRRQAQLASKLKREHYQSVLETVSNLRNIRAMGCEDIWLERLQQKVAKAANAKRKSSLAQRFLVASAAAAVPVAGGATAVLGAILVMNEQMTTGALISAMILMWRVLAPIQQLFVMLTHISDMGQTAHQIDRMMRLPSVKPSNGPKIGLDFKGQITFDRVSFRYQNSALTTLQGLNFSIKPGEFVAIEGASGSGKSSILRLILDLHRPQVGNIMIDTINIRQIPDADLRSAIGYVPQKPVLFHGTLAQNLRLAAPQATDEELEDVCREMGLENIIASMPKGINTVLDHARRENMSGGVQQAISIAQALLQGPQILLLDEPAKSLDYELDTAFLNALDRRRNKMTIIMVSHRPSHIRLADRVLTLDRGAIVSFEPPKSREAA